MNEKSAPFMGPYVAQSLAAIIANLEMLSAGMIFGWPSPSLPKLLQEPEESTENTDLKITADEGSWVVSFTSFGAIFGPLLLNLVVDRIGRKWSLSLVALPILVSWIVIGMATSAEALYVGRFISGLSLGAVYALMPMYLGEIAEDRIRGALVTLMITITNAGMLLSYCIGPWISRTTLSIVSAIPPLMLLLLFPWVPETPYFLLMKGYEKKAVASLMWLRRRSDVDVELSSLKAVIMEVQKNREDYGLRSLFGSAVHRKAFFISIGLLTLQQFSGVIAIQSYASLIFAESGFEGFTNYSVMIMGAVKLVAGISTSFVIDSAGRRPVLMTSSVLTSFFLACAAIFFHLKDLDFDTSSFSWLPLVAIIGFYTTYVPGLSAVPYTMISELFPINVKALASMILAMYGSVMGVLIAKIYQSVGETIGTHWMFYVFGFTTLIGVLFTYFCVPETKRLSLENIQENLNSR